jgi:hypothetical protein
MSNEMDAMIAAARNFRGTEALGAQTREVTDSETRSTAVVGQVNFELMDLRVGGLGNKPASPSNSPFIIAEDEKYKLSVEIEFNQSPLTELLMCLGTLITVNFGLEGYGIKAPEVDVQASIQTTKGQFKYVVEYEGTAQADGLLPGLYEIGAVCTVGPVKNECTTKVWGHGYIKEVVLQVYPAGQE